MNDHIENARTDLACALRWACRLGFHEGVCNHFSLAVPDADGRLAGNLFLINPYGWHWSEITASSLVLCDAEGRVLEGENTVEDTAFFIHSRIHTTAPQATCILHTHMPYTTALTLLEEGRLEMCEQNALMFDGRIAYDDDYHGLVLDPAEGARIAAKLSGCSALMLASHGVIVTGKTVADAFNDLYYLERAAMLQVLARSTGQPLRKISAAVRETTGTQFATELPQVADRHFTALRRILDREEPEYRN
jgi:ribulose-5-phosphate 4-epimerase/fuculose-1-phosphate aldolase